MLDCIIFMIKLVGISLGIVTYGFQWIILMCEIIDGKVKSKREIIWKVIPFGFLLLVFWKWQELSKKEIVYEAEVINENNGGEEKCLKNT